MLHDSQSQDGELTLTMHRRMNCLNVSQSINMAAFHVTTAALRGQFIWQSRSFRTLDASKASKFYEASAVELFFCRETDLWVLARIEPRTMGLGDEHPTKPQLHFKILYVKARCLSFSLLSADNFLIHCTYSLC